VSISATPTSTSSLEAAGGPAAASQARLARGAQRLGGRCQPVVEQHRVDALLPLGALVDQGLAQPHQLTQVQDVRWGDPRFRQPVLLQQLPQVAGISPVGLGAALAASQRGGVGRFGQVRGHPGRRKLLGHKPPAGAALHREVAVTRGQLAQPPSQHLTRGRGDLPPPGLTGLSVDPVVGDLPAMHVKRSYDHHGTSFGLRHQMAQHITCA
jgi:hypothetical protein